MTSDSCRDPGRLDDAALDVLVCRAAALLDQLSGARGLVPPGKRGVLDSYCTGIALLLGSAAEVGGADLFEVAKGGAALARAHAAAG